MLAGNVDYVKYMEGDKVKYVADHGNYPPKIPDDNVSYIQESNSKFIPTDTMDNRKLVIKIYKL